jgi:hypothetical protein
LGENSANLVTLSGAALSSVTCRSKFQQKQKKGAKEMDQLVNHFFL